MVAPNIRSIKIIIDKHWLSWLPNDVITKYLTLKSYYLLNNNKKNVSVFIF